MGEDMVPVANVEVVPVDNRVITLRGKDVKLPILKPADIRVLDRATQSVSWERVSEYLEGIAKDVTQSLTDNPVGDVTKRSRLGRLIGRSHEYLHVNAYDLSDGIKDRFSGIVTKTIPSDVLDAAVKLVGDRDNPGIELLEKGLTNLYREIGVYLRYGLATPMDFSTWDEHTDKVVPVVLRRGNILWYSDRIEPFNQVEDSRGRSESEDMQMIPLPINEESLGFYVEKVADAFIAFDSDSRRFAAVAAKLAEEESHADTEQRTHFDMDTRMLNQDLATFCQNPKSNAARMLAIRMGTAIRRMGSIVVKSADALKKKAEEIARLGTTCYWADSHKGLKTKLEGAYVGAGYHPHRKRSYNGGTYTSSLSLPIASD